MADMVVSLSRRRGLDHHHVTVDSADGSTLLELTIDDGRVTLREVAR
ncbi:hypothetical protein [Mycobacterium sp. SMC-4]